ncbi:MAG TPA: hypothetical protein DDX54_00035 [Rhodospirillaceae bacterium]|jgi:glycine oxidase|nr:FAD-dependent oxidoreductase [Alphaproteobacteria bacterium]HBH25782.1 hypothetical protein [Rhodospirillaceae bacterium]
MTLSGKHVAVVGAGVAGLCAALSAARRGARVTVFEREPFPPQDTPSAIAGGMLAPVAEAEHLPLAFGPLGLEGVAAWEDLLGPAGGYFRRTGSLILAHPGDEAMLERFALHMEPGRWEDVGPQRIADLEPALAGRFARGLFLPEDAHLEPLSAMRAAGAALEALGGQIVQREIREPAALLGDFAHVLDCRGYVSEGEDPDLRGVKGEIAVLESREFTLARPVRLLHPRYPLYVVPHPGGRFAVGATAIEDSADADGRVFVRSALELLGTAYSLAPCLGEAKVVGLFSGIRPAYPDNLPRIAERGEALRANGLFRHGYLLAPTMGRAMAAHLAGEEDPAWPLFAGRMNASAAPA